MWKREWPEAPARVQGREKKWETEHGRQTRPDHKRRRSRAESEKKPREKGERKTERGRQEKETEWGGVSRRREQSQNSRLIRGVDSWPLFTRQDLGKWNSLWP